MGADYYGGRMGRASGGKNARVAQAVCGSLVPAWSGSFINGFDWGGLAFTIMKSFSAGCLVYYGVAENNVVKKWEREVGKPYLLLWLYGINILNTGYQRLGAAGYLSRDTKKPGDNKLDHFIPDSAKKLLWVGAIGLPLFTIGDMIYSGLMAAKHGKKRAGRDNGRDGSVSWGVAPRVYTGEQMLTRNGEPVTMRWNMIDGADLAMSHSF